MNQSVNTPLVSILITSYNRESLIAAAIASAQVITYPNIEIVIVDDCSVDNTREVVHSFMEKDTRIRYYRNERNLGDYPNRNRAASYVRGEYFTYLDSDDLMIPDGLQKCMNAMLSHPQAGIGMYWAATHECPSFFEKQEAIRYHFFTYPFLVVGPGGTVLKKAYFDSINGYPEKYGPANDMYFNLKAACYSDVVLFPFTFYFYRKHDVQESTSWYGYLFNNYLFLKDALDELPLPLTDKQKRWLSDKNKRRFLVTVVRYLFITRKFKDVRTALQKTGFSLRDVRDALFH